MSAIERQYFCPCHTIGRRQLPQSLYLLFHLFSRRKLQWGVNRLGSCSIRRGRSTYTYYI